ncbi:ATP-dependent sacrificial sulfur transferase LarE [Desulfitobacterium metallireducens]|uniref:Potassium-transporting ATPase subunit A n=1 Tax=Desulfitobacterium metallireducens DSM 15288 TaxID=871968 RepID=W0EBC0_9FIRM|nr:ATP-dependent sacrificial sulfur transferase LarE [Desulfitobacterium metallireducens]AHF06356.1 potassium-transporting ATPase subunit A [Desulfitobacterium metallireducens DSM 15288]
MTLDLKLTKLKNILKDMGSVLIAYSGGVDSSFLAKVAFDMLGEKSLAVTATSETYPECELDEAITTAKTIGINHLVIHSNELTDPNFRKNPQDRCYYCKSTLFLKLKAIQVEQGISIVVDGANLDDLQDYRPGHRAKEEQGVRSPLQEVGMTKEDIRLLSKELGLSTWNKPSLACLSSRIPYGEEITVKKLKMIDQAETVLRQLGFKERRVRYHQEIARVELPRQDFAKLTDAVIEEIVTRLKGLGFTYVTLDLQGLRSGSMNEVLKEEGM